MRKIATFLAFYGFSCGILRLFRILRDFLRKNLTFFAFYGFFDGILRPISAATRENADFCGILQISAKLFCLVIAYWHNY